MVVYFLQSDIFSFPIGFAVNIGERILLEDDHDDHTVSFSEIGDISFNELLRKEKTIIEQDENTRDIVEGIRLENESGRLLLNGTDISSTDAGDKVSLEPFLKSDRSSSGAVDQDNANAVENTGILLENFGQILLDGSDNSGTDENSYLAQETTKNNRFTLERSGSIVTEDFDTSSVVEHLVTEMNDGDKFILEDLILKFVSQYF